MAETRRSDSTEGERHVCTLLEAELLATSFRFRFALRRPPFGPVHLRVGGEVPLVTMHYPITSAGVKAMVRVKIRTAPGRDLHGRAGRDHVSCDNPRPTAWRRRALRAVGQSWLQANRLVAARSMSGQVPIESMSIART
jgi:hypothetical protein